MVGMVIEFRKTDFRYFVVVNNINLLCAVDIIFKIIQTAAERAAPRSGNFVTSQLAARKKGKSIQSLSNVRFSEYEQKSYKNSSTSSS
jgi:hypothetical protein